MIISILINNPNSWLWEYINEFKTDLENLGYEIKILGKNEELKNGGEISFFLGCTAIVPEEYLSFYKYNFVIHHSDLPKGRGSSPLVWQVIEGKSEIPFSLFDAERDVDTGKIYKKAILKLDGSELLDEIFYKRWQVEKEMILNLLSQYPDIKGEEQEGKPTFYRRRNKKDDEISIDMTIKGAFNELRIHDNDKWPAFFHYKGNKYYIKIYKEKD